MSWHWYWGSAHLESCWEERRAALIVWQQWASEIVAQVEFCYWGRRKLYCGRWRSTETTTGRFSCSKGDEARWMAGQHISWGAQRRVRWVMVGSSAASGLTWTDANGWRRHPQPSTSWVGQFFSCLPMLIDFKPSHLLRPRNSTGFLYAPGQVWKHTTPLFDKWLHLAYLMFQNVLPSSLFISIKSSKKMQMTLPRRESCRCLLFVYPIAEVIRGVRRMTLWG